MTWWTKKGIINHLSTSPYIYYIKLASTSHLTLSFLNSWWFKNLSNWNKGNMIFWWSCCRRLCDYIFIANSQNITCACVLVVVAIMIISLGTKQTFDDWTTILQEPFFFFFFKFIFLLCPWVPPPYLRGGIYLVVTTEVLYIWGRERERERERGPPLSHYSNTFPSTRQAEKL
jgi:hypothetical protein